MSTKRIQDLVNEALAGRADGRAELAAQMSGLSIEDLARAPPSAWSLLDADGRARLLQNISPGALPLAPRRHSAEYVEQALQTEARMPLANSRRIRLWGVVHKTPAALQGLVAGMAAGLTSVVIAIAAISLFQVTHGWPSEAATATTGTCPRLSSVVDRCAYRVQTVLTWAEAAVRAGVSEAKLRKDNPRLAPHPLWPDDNLFILR